MKKITAEEAKLIDHKAQQEFHIPALILMENAGLEVFKHSKKFLRSKDSKIVFFCGRGNNAGDTFVAVRHFINNGYNKIKVIVLKKQNEDFSKEADINFKILTKLTNNILLIREKFDSDKIKSLAQNAELIIDGLLGIGLKGEVRGNFKKSINLINSCNATVLSVDIPSGLNATSGKIGGACIKATETITFGLPKIGCYKKDGPKVSGKITTYSIIFPRILLK